MAKFAIYRVSKCKIAGLTALAKEHGRTVDTDITRMSPGIDATRTSTNEHWGTRDYVTTAKELCASVGARVRSNSVLCLDHVVTFSPEAFPYTLWLMHISPATKQNKAWLESETGEKIKKIIGNASKEDIFKNAEIEIKTIKNYFMDSVDWLNKNMGQVISWDIHWDESTPHLQAITVPLKQRGNGTWSLTAKEIVGDKVKLRQHQTTFANEVGANYLLQRGKERIGMEEAIKHKSVAEHWANTLNEEKHTLENEVKRLEERLTLLQDQIQKEKRKKMELEADAIVKLRERLEEIKDRFEFELRDLKTEKDRELALQKAKKKVRALDIGFDR